MSKFYDFIMILQFDFMLDLILRLDELVFFSVAKFYLEEIEK